MPPPLSVLAVLLPTTSLTHSPTHPYPRTHIILYQTQVTLRPNEGGSLLISVRHTEPVKMSLACATQGNVKVRCSETKIHMYDVHCNVFVVVLGLFLNFLSLSPGW